VSYLADGEPAVWSKVARLVRLESGLSNLLARGWAPTQPQKRDQFHLETFANGVYPGGSRRRKLRRRRDVEVAELGTEAHRVLGLFIRIK